MSFNKLLHRIKAAGVFVGIYILFSVISDVAFKNDLGLNYLSSSPIRWVGFVVLLLLIAPLIFRQLGLKK